MPLIFVGDGCHDHSPSSGYHQLCGLFPEAGWLSGRGLENGAFRWYRRPRSRTRSNPTVFHVLYGDCSGRRLPALLRARFATASIVSTVHQPVDRLVLDPVAVDALHASDLVITVSRLQAEQLVSRDLHPAPTVVAHGTWTGVFAPSPHRTGPRSRVLAVGNYLRDWRDTQQTIDRLAATGIGSIIVGSHAQHRVSFRSPLVEIRPRVSEAELAALYDEAAALLLAVEDATACNAALEAMAAGCPVVCTDVPALTEDYVGDGVDAFPRHRCDLAVDRISAYVDDSQRRSRRSELLRERARQFDWARLQPTYQAAYDSVSSTAQS